MGTGHSMTLAVNKPWAPLHCQTRKEQYNTYKSHKFQNSQLFTKKGHT